MWYGEKIWPTFVALATVAVFSGMMWSERRQSRYLVIAGLCIPLGIGAWMLERRIVTPREVVAGCVDKIVNSFEHKDRQEMQSLISRRSPDLLRLANSAMEKVAISNVRITDINVEISGEETLRARAHFRVNADVVLIGVNHFNHQPTRWIATWEQEGDAWRMLEIEQLDPISGETMHDARQFAGR